MQNQSDDRLLPVPAPFSRRWSDRFALDIAMHLQGSGDPPDVIMAEYGYTKDDLILFSNDPLFMQRVERFKTQLAERGLGFKMRAQAQAELLLDTSWDIIHDKYTSPAVKADLIKWTGKMAGFEPTKDSGPGEGGVSINIYTSSDPNAPPSGTRIVEID